MTPSRQHRSRTGGPKTHFGSRWQRQSSGRNNRPRWARKRHWERMKIVTYNVNGLRQRIAQFGSLRNLLNSFDADIICFQETKLRRQDLTADLVMADGYESFFSCTRTSDKGRTGYSGNLFLWLYLYVLCLDIKSTVIVVAVRKLHLLHLEIEARVNKSLYWKMTNLVTVLYCCMFEGLIYLK